MKKLKRSPPGSVEDFISSAEQKKEQIEQSFQKLDKVYPWEMSEVREDVAKVYNLRLPEPYLLKLKYIAEHTPESMQTFCLRVLLPGIDKKIKELIHE